MSGSSGDEVPCARGTCGCQEPSLDRQADAYRRSVYHMDNVPDGEIIDWDDLADGARARWVAAFNDMTARALALVSPSKEF